MRIYNKISEIKNFKKSVVAIGNFDGVHLGHQKVLKQAKTKAINNKLKFGVVTFEPMPVMFFNKKIIHHRINTLDQKIEYLKKFKVDFLLIIKFNKKISNLKYKEFIKKILSKKLNSKFIFISQNFRFGKNREGNVKRLKENESFFSYRTCVSPLFFKKNKILSSSVIRNEIRRGNIDKANKSLGREWVIEGKVTKGQRRGRKIGFPTCNINIKNYVLPHLGVYSVKVEVSNLKRFGIANIGYRPTFRGKKLLLEVNIFNLKANLYNKKIKVSFIKFIRSEKKFNNMKQLKIQIKKDIIKAKK